ncbi:Uncharacterized protein GBIM_05820 [Gryllus bimaculatus]|nr:Uncharacterized protein GBIM_05820 [Gryllus bimaculatus]
MAAQASTPKGQVLVNKQFNSPIKMYSAENVAEVLNKQTQVLENGAVGSRAPYRGSPASRSTRRLCSRTSTRRTRRRPPSSRRPRPSSCEPRRPSVRHLFRCSSPNPPPSAPQPPRCAVTRSGRPASTRSAPPWKTSSASRWPAGPPCARARSTATTPSSSRRTRSPPTTRRTRHPQAHSTTSRRGRQTSERAATAAVVTDCGTAREPRTLRTRASALGGARRGWQRRRKVGSTAPPL